MKSYIPRPDLCTISYMADTALSRLQNIGPIFRSTQATSAGVSWRDLYRLRDSGAIVELSRGLFQLADTIGFGHSDFVAVCARAPHGMVCLDSALSYWDFTDDIPSVVHLAVPSGSTRPSIDYPPTRVHVFDAEKFSVGREKVDEDEAVFWITDRERTVVDAFRMRHTLGEQVAITALRRYLAQQPRRGRLAEIARRFRAFAPLSAALRVLDA